MLVKVGPGDRKLNPRYCSLAATALKLQQIPMFLHISARVWGHWWYPQTSEQWDFCVKTTIILQWKCLCVPDCTDIESMHINFIQMSLYIIYFPQRLFHINLKETYNMAAWKELWCPQHVQRTLWQIVVTPCTSFRVFQILLMQIL